MSRYLIVNGDCRRVLGDLSRFNAIVSDPPYGINFKHSGHGTMAVKLSDEQVRFVRAYVDTSRRDGMSVALANMWGVTPALIYQIASGKMRRSVV